MPAIKMCRSIFFMGETYAYYMFRTMIDINV